jgi:hypothetical protein
MLPFFPIFDLLSIDHGKSDELGSGPNWKKWHVLKD